MSLAVIARLEATAAVTNDLANGSDSIVPVREDQGESKPYIVVISGIDDPHDDYSGQSMDEYGVQVVVVADRIYTDGANIGAKNIAGNVRSALHGFSGSSGGETVKHMVFESEDPPDPIYTTDDTFREYELLQEYRVYIDR